MLYDFLPAWTDVRTSAHGRRPGRRRGRGPIANPVGPHGRMVRGGTTAAATVTGVAGVDGQVVEGHQAGPNGQKVIATLDVAIHAVFELHVLFS